MLLLLLAGSGPAVVKEIGNISGGIRDSNEGRLLEARPVVLRESQEGRLMR